MTESRCCTLIFRVVTLNALLCDKTCFLAGCFLDYRIIFKDMSCCRKRCFLFFKAAMCTCIYLNTVLGAGLFNLSNPLEGMSSAGILNLFFNNTADRTGSCLFNGIEAILSAGIGPFTAVAVCSGKLSLLYNGTACKALKL